MAVRSTVVVHSMAVVAVVVVHVGTVVAALAMGQKLTVLRTQFVAMLEIVALPQDS